jgi:hypothetical protein
VTEATRAGIHCGLITNGFDTVAFSYPRREALGPNAFAFDESSKLIDLGRDELLDALRQIENLKRHFPVVDPGAALAEVACFVRGEKQYIPCIGGSKYFFIDWNLDIWRCEAWSEPMGSRAASRRLARGGKHTVPAQRRLLAGVALRRNASQTRAAKVTKVISGESRLPEPRTQWN